MDSAESAPTRYNQEQSQEQSQSDQHQEAQNSDQCIDSSKLLEEKRWLVLANLSLKFQLEQAKQKEIAALHALSRTLFSYSKQAHTEDKDAYDAQATKLAEMFKENFVKYTGPGVTDYTEFGPKQ